MFNPSNLQSIADAVGGLIVRGSIPGSPSALAGIRYGDIVLAVDGIPTPTLDAYLDARRSAGDVIRVTLFRAGARVEIELDCRKGPAEFDPALIERLRAARAFGAD